MNIFNNILKGVVAFSLLAVFFLAVGLKPMLSSNDKSIPDSISQISICKISAADTKTSAGPGYTVCVGG